jgi:perosamine synthetase
MSPRRIPVAGPDISDREVELVAEAARNAWYEDAGVVQQRFERAFADRIGCEHAVALPSCTSALHLALAALGVGPGDEVIVPESTWIATAAPIMYLGATPVFADIDPVTWCLSPDSVAENINIRTKAIIGVDLYGGMCDWPALTDIARPQGIALVEDAAEAIGSSLLGIEAGNHADVGAFSFHGSKTMTTGEGGMLVTNRSDILERVLVLRDHGRKPGDTNFFNEEVGFKYRMSAMQAAMGIGQLERLNELVDKKRAIFDLYSEMFVDAEGLTLNAEPAGVFNSYWMTTVVADPSLGMHQNDLMRVLAGRNIDSRPFFHPLSSLPAFRNHPSTVGARVRNPNAYRISQYGINLPSALCLSVEDVMWIGCVVRAALESSGRSAARSAA